jgi:hypothetical protein
MSEKKSAATPLAPTAGPPADTVVSFEVFKVPPRWLFLRVETAKGGRVLLPLVLASQ